MRDRFDDYGVSKTLQNIFASMTNAARDTGRTTRALEGLQPGDVFVTCGKAGVGDARRKLAAMGKEGVNVEHIDPNGPGSDRLRWVYDFAFKTDSRVVFDHFWVECFAEFQVRNMFSSLNHLEAEHKRRRLDAAGKAGQRLAERHEYRGRE